MHLQQSQRRSAYTFQILFSFCAGGTGGLGILTATWLSQRSALALVLGSRSGRIANCQELQAFVSMECEVTLFAGDSASAEAASGLLSSNNRQPLAGISHAAGIQVHSLILADKCLHPKQIERAF